MIYIIFVRGLVYPSRKALIAGPKIEEITVSTEYLDFADVFSSNSVAELSEHSGINDHFIDLKKGKQSLYGLIYSLELVELKFQKIYLKTNLASGFIKLLKLPAGRPILFIYKKNGSFQLYVDY